MTTNKPMILSVNSTHDLVAYAAGCVVVLYNHKLDKQVGLLCSSTFKRPSPADAGAGSTRSAGSLWSNNAFANPNSNPMAGLMPMGAQDPSSLGSAGAGNSKGVKPKPISCLTFSSDGQFLAIGEVRKLQSVQQCHSIITCCFTYQCLLINTLDWTSTTNLHLGGGNSIIGRRTSGPQVWCASPVLFAQLKASSLHGLSGIMQQQVAGSNRLRNGNLRAHFANTFLGDFSMMALFTSGTGGQAPRSQATRSRRRSILLRSPWMDHSLSRQDCGMSSSGT